MSKHLPVYYGSRSVLGAGKIAEIRNRALTMFIVQRGHRPESRCYSQINKLLLVLVTVKTSSKIFKGG